MNIKHNLCFMFVVLCLIRRCQGATLLDFAVIINHITDRGALEYNNYGCHCGSGTKGPRIVDQIDQCCFIHDQCYDGSKWYSFKKDYMTMDIKCTDQKNTPHYRACECDRQAALCFRDNDFWYNQWNKNYSKDACKVSQRQWESRWSHYA